MFLLTPVILSLWKDVMKRLLVLCLLTLCSPINLLAQATEGSVLGSVFDQSGAVLPGAAITVRNIQTNFPRTTVTNSAGEYVVSNLPIGFYSISAEMPGFNKYIEPSVEMTLKARVRVDFHLKAGDVVQSINVTGSGPLLKTDTIEVSTLITRQQLDSLPSLDRNFLSLQVLTPGTLRYWPGAGGDRVGDFSGGESMQVNGVNSGQNNSSWMAFRTM